MDSEEKMNTDDNLNDELESLNYIKLDQIALNNEFQNKQARLDAFVSALGLNLVNILIILAF